MNVEENLQVKQYKRLVSILPEYANTVLFTAPHMWTSERKLSIRGSAIN